MNWTHEQRGAGASAPAPDRIGRPPAPPRSSGAGLGALACARGAGRAFVVFVLLTLLAGGPLSAAAAGGWSATAEAVVYGVAASADGSLLVAGGRDNLTVAYDRDGKELWTFPAQGTVYDVAVSADGTRVAIASEDRHVYFLDGSGKELWNYRGSQTFLSVSMTGDGSMIAAGSEDHTASLFDSAGRVLWQYTAGDQVTNVALYGTARGFRLVAGSRDSRVALLSGAGQVLWQTTLNYSVRGLSVTPNGARIAAGDNRETLYSLNGGTGKIEWKASIGSPIPAIAITSDGQRIVAGSAKGELAVYNAKGDRVQSTNVGGSFNDLALAGDGSFVAVANADRVSIYPNSPDGGFQAPRQANQIWRWLGLGAALLVAAALIAALLGVRKRPGGERAWRGSVEKNRALAGAVWKARVSYLFLIPTLVMLLIFNYYPAFSGIYHAFTVWNPGIETRWVGLKQFRELAANHYFWTGIVNLLILIATGFLKLMIPLAVAEMIFLLRNSRIRYIFRTLFVLQVIVPGVVGILLWVNVYDPNIGLANQLLRAVGLGGLTRSWLGDSHTAIWSIVFMGFPWVGAFALLIFYGGLISIPSEIIDASELDGASTLRRIFNVDLPLLMGQFRLLLILTFIAMVQEFAAVFLTTGGGPGSATYVPSLELYYQAVRFNNFGNASAIGAVLFIVILAGTILNLRYVKSSVEYGS